MLHTGNTLQNAAANADIVTMGVKPSSMHIHQGHQITFVNFFRALMQTKTGRGVILVEDREFDWRNIPVRLYPALATQTAAIKKRAYGVLTKAAEFYHEPSVLQRIDITAASDLYRWTMNRICT